MLLLVARASVAQDGGDGQPVSQSRPIGAMIDADRRIAFPEADRIVDVTQPPYNAAGDGETDDTEALQRALHDNMGHHRIIYLPPGTYLVSDTLEWSKQDSSGREAWGFNWVQGAGVETVIRLKDGTFTDPNEPRSIMWCGGFGSADWFHNYVHDITFDVGQNNPGAVGLQFYANNMGAARNIRIVSQDGQGAIGLDMSHRDMNGPLLARNIEVDGFDIGVRAGHTVNSQTFEHITLTNQNRVAFVNEGQSVAIRGLRSENSVPALRAASFTVIIDSELIGQGDASDVPAIHVGDTAFLARNVTTSGYQAALVREDGAEGVAEADIDEYMTGDANAPFGGPRASLNLPIRETPEVPWDDPADWVVIEPVPDGGDAAPIVQEAIDNGATSILLSHEVAFHSPVIVRNKVRRIMSTGGQIGQRELISPDLIIEDGEAPVVVIEHFSRIGGGIEIRTDRPVVLRSIESNITTTSDNDLYFEDVCTHDFHMQPGQNVWARQLNIENYGTHFTNNGGQAWIFGYKTERGGTLVHTRNGGRSEVLGTFCYSTSRVDLAPMFVTEDASAFAYFTEVAYGERVPIFVEETRNGETKTVPREEGGIAPYIGYVEE
ncbi:MAG: glycosyl hydrolase family 28-related protein [Phycisphaeraceae bacterium]